MTTPPASPVAHAAASTGRFARSLAVLGVAGATMALSFSSAFFTDTDDTAAETITTGTVVLGADAAIDFSLTNMAPGDESNKSITIDNDGSLQLRYDMSTAEVDSDGTTPLSQQLDVTVYLESEEDGEASDIVANTTCDATLAGAAGFSKLIDAGVLADAALTDRVLDAGASEVLCFLVDLDTATGNDYQGDTTDITFTFDSEQTVNN